MSAASSAKAGGLAARIEELVAGIPGWSPLDQLTTLYHIAFFTSDLPGDVVEIGSWTGRSSVVLAAAIRDAGGGTLHCVDLFPEKSDWFAREDGSWSFRVAVGGVEHLGHPVNPVWQEPFARDVLPVYEPNESLLATFGRNVADRGLGDFVRPFRGTSATFAGDLPPGFRSRLVFIDAAHDYDSVCGDIRSLAPTLVPGGWLCLDDAFAHYEGVDRAIRELVIDSGSFAPFQQMTRKLFVARRRR